MCVQTSEDGQLLLDKIASVSQLLQKSLHV